MKRSEFLESLRQWLPTPPRLSPIGAGGSLQFAASGGGGGGDYDDPDDEFYDDVPEEPAPRRRREAGRQATAGRQRTVQSDPDDRYWTDYLRIALPVIGLLLVIAVFWYWAQQLIDDPEEDLTPTEPGLAEVISQSITPPAESAPPASPTVAVEDAAQNVAPTAPPQQQNPQQAIPSPTPDQGADQGVPPEGEDAGTDNQVDQQADQQQAGGIAPDAEVTVVEGPLRLRAEPSTQAEIVTELETGAALTVLSGPEEGEGYVWWQVVDTVGGNQGWVVEEFIQPAG